MAPSSTDSSRGGSEERPARVQSGRDLVTVVVAARFAVVDAVVGRLMDSTLSDLAKLPAGRRDAMAKAMRDLVGQLADTRRSCRTLLDSLAQLHGDTQIAERGGRIAAAVRNLERFADGLDQPVYRPSIVRDAEIEEDATGTDEIPT